VRDQQRLFDATPYVGPKVTPAYQAKWRRKNPEKVKAYEDKRRGLRRAYNREWTRNNPEKRFASDLRRRLKKYGLTIDQFKDLVAKQQGLCAICKRPPDARKTTGGRRYWRLDVDHSHLTGKVRALLCCSCNGLLGYARDSIEVLSLAIDYLRAHE
jgi:hypothetical protein